MAVFQMVISPQRGELLRRPMARWKARDLYFVTIPVSAHFGYFLLFYFSGMEMSNKIAVFLSLDYGIFADL